MCDCGRIVLTMGGWLKSLAKWCLFPLRGGGFTELDMQIAKLRMLRDSYNTPLQGQANNKTMTVNKEGKRFCLQ